MRVIAGSARGTRLQVARVRGLRPTGDRARETLFNVLAPVVAGTEVLDLFAGSGALGIEALSRGAAGATFVERDRRAVEVLRANLSRCRLDGRAAVLACDWRQGVRRLARQAPSFDLLFLDPPYDSEVGNAVIAALAASDVAAAGATLVLEHRRGHTLPADPGWEVRRALAVGDTAFAICRRVAADQAPC